VRKQVIKKYIRHLKQTESQAAINPAAKMSNMHLYITKNA